MRFKIDENLPDEVALFFRAEGYEARTVAEQGARGFVDPRLAELCREHDEILVTMDMDFTDIRTYPPSEYPGFLVLRAGVQNKPVILKLLRQHIGVLKGIELYRHLTILSDRGVRTYPGD